ncbi:MAG: PEP-CTERM sorting domain-containing protein [Phycisphaerae bacterium]|nr:PEP-CTERM sorting domain-containing protein [Phycisphaerae bacterium]
MKAKLFSRMAAVAATLAVAWAVAPANAATVDWSQAAKVAANSDVATGGSLVEAYSFNATGSATSPDVNNVIFTGVKAGAHTLTFGSNSDTLVDSVTGTANLGGYNGYGSPTALSSLTAYDSLLTSGAYDSTSTNNGTLTLSLNNLTAGNTYQYEMWVNDTRVNSIIAQRFVNVTAGNTVGLYYQTPASTSATKNGGEFAIGNFTADATSQVITIAGNTDAQINAFQLRTGGALPNAGLVTNSGFESNPVSTNGFTAYTAGSTAITGWTVDPTTAADNGGVQLLGIHFNGSGYGIQFAPQNQGQILQLTNSTTAAGGVQQTLATVTGQQYSISLDLAARYYTGTSAIALGTLDFGGTLFNLTGTGAFNRYTFTTTATSSSTLLDIYGLNAAGTNVHSALIDNVSVVAVPEPASMAILAIGGAGLLLVRRRKQA